MATVDDAPAGAGPAQGQPPPATIATLAGGATSAGAILYILLRLQDSVGVVSGQVAVMTEQIAGARAQIMEVRAAQERTALAVETNNRRITVLEAQRDQRGR